MGSAGSSRRSPRAWAPPGLQQTWGDGACTRAGQGAVRSSPRLRRAGASALGPRMSELRPASAHCAPSPPGGPWTGQADHPPRGRRALLRPLSFLCRRLPGAQPDRPVSLQPLPGPGPLPPPHTLSSQVASGPLFPAVSPSWPSTPSGLEGTPPAPHTGLRPPSRPTPHPSRQRGHQLPCPGRSLPPGSHAAVNADLGPVRPGPAHSGCRKQRPSEHGRRQPRSLRPPSRLHPGRSHGRGAAGPQRARAARGSATRWCLLRLRRRAWAWGEPWGGPHTPGCAHAPRPLSGAGRTGTCIRQHADTPSKGPARGPRIADTLSPVPGDHHPSPGPWAGPPAAGGWQGTHQEQEVPLGPHQGVWPGAQVLI